MRKTEQAFLYYQWGYCLERRQNERSLAYFRKSIALWEELGDNWWMALGFSGLGFNLSWSNRFLEARDYLQKSIELFERYGNARELVTLHERMSDSCQFQGDLDAARYHGQRALTLAEGAGDRKALADALRRMSVVSLLTEGNLEKADELNDRALAIYQSLNIQIGYALALALRAKHSLVRGHVQAAQHDFDVARAIFSTQQLRQGEGYSLRWLAIAAQMNGRQTDALEMINTSIDIFAEVGADNFIPHLRVIRFLIDKKTRPTSEALTQLAEILHHAIEIREYFDVLWSLPAIAYCLLQEESSVTDNSIPHQIALAAEISGFIDTNFEYGHSAYMRSLAHDEVQALLTLWPQAEIVAAQIHGKKTTVWEIAEAVWETIQRDTTKV
jgi:tetratricopeptide (TPR) repeat protein